MEAVESQGVLVVDNEAFGVRTRPLPDVQLGVVALISDTSHQNGVFLGTELVGECLNGLSFSLNLFLGHIWALRGLFQCISICLD